MLLTTNASQGPPEDEKPGPREGGTEHRAEPRLPPPMIPVEERREIIDAITFPASGRTIDRFVHAVLGRMTFGVSPAAAILAYLDWLAHRDGAGQAGGARAGSRRP